MWRAAEQGGAAEAWCTRWGVEPDGAAVVTHHGWLRPVRRDGVPLMLKIVAPDDEEVRGAELLALWGGEGAVRLIAQAGGVMLMERVEQDGPDPAAMVAAGRDAEATDILCDVALRLSGVAAPARPGWRDMGDRRDDVIRDLARGKEGAADLVIFDAALAVAGRRLAERGDWRLLHGDLHHFNALRGARGWLAIDPKGIVGPLEAEFAPILCNPLPMSCVADPARMAARLEQIAARTGLAQDALADWTLVHVAACAAWSRGADKPWWLAVMRAAARVAGVV